MRKIRFFAAVSLLSVLVGCAPEQRCVTSADGARSCGKFVPFSALPGWSGVQAEAARDVLLKQCSAKKVPALEKICTAAENSPDARAFFETNFRPMRLSEKGEATGLMTGYYEPLLHGALRRSGRFRYPLYAPPKDLLHIELSKLYPDLGHRCLRGKLEGRRVVPYLSRSQINAKGVDADVLCWLDSDIDRFFLHVQGSGRIALEEGGTLFVGHTDRNGRPYRSIGKLMVEEGLIPREKISLQSIKAWLEAHPEEKKRILESNPSYIFFGTRKQGATGTLGVELTPMRSVAVDRTKIPLGWPLFYDAADPVSHKPLRGLALAQDTGSAIKGQVRADLFWGHGEAAEAKAGRMKSPLKLWLLVPKDAVE